MDLSWQFISGLPTSAIQVFRTFSYVVYRFVPIQSADTPMLATISDIEVDLGEQEGNFDLTFGLWTDETYTETLSANTESGFQIDAR